LSLAALALLAAPALALGQASTDTISLAEVLQRAADGPEVQAARAGAKASQDTAKAAWRSAFLPKVGGGLTYSHLIQDQTVVLPNLGGIILPPTPIEANLTLGLAQVSQTLFDPASMLYNYPSAERKAAAERIRASRQAKETQGTAVGYHLQILELRAKRDALERYRANLAGRLNEVKRLYQLGAVSESDLLKIELGISDSDQGIRELQEREGYLAQQLAVTLGAGRARAPEDLPEELPRPAFAPELPQLSGLERIKAIDTELESIRAAQKGQKADYLPKVSGFAQHFYTDLNLFSRSNFDAAGVLLTWSLFDGGAGWAKAQAARARRDSLERSRFLEAGSIQASFDDAVNLLRIKRQEYDQRRAAVLDARKVAELEFKRLRNGKTTVNDLIDAEDLLKDRSEKASLSRVAWYEAWFRMQLAAGVPLTAP
jgi:outer membrane protein TolC